MRKVRPIDSLISPVKQAILAATYGQPERWWYLSELASFAGRTPSSMQRELSSMAASGLLVTRRDGKRLYFRAESRSPVFKPLRELVNQTLGIVAEIRGELGNDDRIRIAFVYGSVAMRKENALSDIDVIVIGDLGLSDLASSIRRLERKFEREINVKCYSVEEFKAKLEDGNHFVNSIMNGPKLFLIGDLDEFERLGIKWLAEASYDEPQRD